MRYTLISKYRSEIMGIAMLWLMLFHSPYLVFPAPFLNALKSGGLFGVDIFILVSAMGLVCSLSRREQSYTEFMGRRAKRILPMYFVVMVPYTLWLIFQKRATWATLIWNATLLNYWVLPQGSFNWYISGLMTFYALTPFLFRRIRNSNHREWLTLVWIVLGTALSQVMMRGGEWMHQDVLYRIPALVLGLLMGFYVLEDRKLGWKDALVWTAGMLLYSAYGLFWLAHQDSVWMRFNYIIPGFLVPICLISALCLEKLPLKWLAKFLRIVGESSLEIYLLSASLFLELPALRQTVLPAIFQNPGVYFPVAWVLNLSLGILMHHLTKALSSEDSAVGNACRNAWSRITAKWQN